jgi:citrate synthase
MAKTPKPDRRVQPRAQSEKWQSSLTEIEPNKILVRGYPLDEMMGRLGFAEAVYLLLMGELPTPAIGRSSAGSGKRASTARRWVGRSRTSPA